ncbi:MAG: endonuclease domain-containing protein [Patescibacteria group bacterium]|jgi:very-short-patch-repair endonuclease
MKKLTPLARRQRKLQNPHELKLWFYLRNRHFSGLKFHRQFPIGRYITDFCCREKKLIIELDGSGHANPSQITKDKQRNAYLKECGYKVIRIWANDLQKNPEAVLEKISQLISE